MKRIAFLDLRFLTELVVHVGGCASPANYKCLLFCTNEETEHSQEVALQKYIHTTVYQSVTSAVKGKAKKKNNRVGLKMKTIRLAARAEGKCRTKNFNICKFPPRATNQSARSHQRSLQWEGATKDAMLSRHGRQGEVEQKSTLRKLAAIASEAATNHG